MARPASMLFFLLSFRQKGDITLCRDEKFYSCVATGTGCTGVSLMYRTPHNIILTCRSISD